LSNKPGPTKRHRNTVAGDGSALDTKGNFIDDPILSDLRERGSKSRKNGNYSISLITLNQYKAVFYWASAELILQRASLSD